MAKRKQKTEEIPNGEAVTTEIAKNEPTKVKSVKVKEKKIEPNPLRKGDSFLFIKDGQEVYLTRSVATVLLKRNSSSLVIPEGSDFVPPEGSKCDGC